MKKIFLSLTLAVGFTITAFASRYASTASTHNAYTQNYSINIIIDGEQNYYGSVINYVMYYDGYSWVRTSVYKNLEGYYQIQVGYSTYYFTF